MSSQWMFGSSKTHIFNGLQVMVVKVRGVIKIVDTFVAWNINAIILSFIIVVDRIGHFSQLKK